MGRFLTLQYQSIIVPKKHEHLQKSCTVLESGARVLPRASHAAALQQFGEVCNFVKHAQVILVLTAVENEKIGLCTKLFLLILVLTRNQP